jgi:hypothetical protein
MYSVQDLKVSTDQTRYNWNYKRKLRTRRSGFWGVTPFLSVNTELPKERGAFIYSHKQFTAYDSSLVK